MLRLLRNLVCLMLVLASPLAAQANPICTQSRTSALVGKTVTFSPADSGTIITTYASRDSQVDKCTKVLRMAKGSVVVPPPVVDTVKPPKPDSVVPPPVVGAVGCQATDLLCETFESGWYTKNCDQANASGGLAQERGWCGTIYNEVGRLAGTSKCGNVGIKSNCVGTTGVMSGGTTGNMADKALSRPVRELHLRFYTKPLSGYTFGAEKMVTFNTGRPGDGGIWGGNLSWNCASNPSSTGSVTMGMPQPMDECARQNLGNALTITSGNWYFYEVHYKLPSAVGRADGVFELWLDNCGPTGTACSGSPTLRMRREDLRISTSDLLSVIWLEAWSNPVSRGERYWDNIRAVEGNVALGF